MDILELHQETWQRLQARRANLPHALLISGQRGIGKLALAEALAAGLLCEQPTGDGRACGTCAACNWHAQGSHPDFRRLQPEALNEVEGDEGDDKKKASQQITIEQVRALDDFLHVGTHRQGLRIVLVNPAEAMNRSTANAMLKTLEEPAPGSLFLLVSNEADRLLPTIRSRCQAVAVPLPDNATASAWLRQAGLGDEARWLALAGGAPCLAAELAEGSGADLLDGLLPLLRRGATLEPLAAATNLDKLVKAEKTTQPLKRLVDWMQKWQHDLALVQTAQAPRFFVAESKALQALSQAVSPPQGIAFYRRLCQLKVEAQTTVNSRLFLEGLLQAYAALFGQRGAR